jgi:hypothetical protein
MTERAIKSSFPYGDMFSYCHAGPMYGDDGEVLVGVVYSGCVASDALSTIPGTRYFPEITQSVEGDFTMYTGLMDEEGDLEESFHFRASIGAPEVHCGQVVSRKPGELSGVSRDLIFPSGVEVEHTARGSAVRFGKRFEARVSGSRVNLEFEERDVAIAWMQRLVSREESRRICSGPFPRLPRSPRST